MERKQHRSSKIENIRGFFDWLIPVLDEALFNEKIQIAISEKLASIDSRIRWEIGPFDGGTNFFAFSPNLDVANIPMAKRLAELAPLLEGWVFLSSKPRKKCAYKTIKIKNNRNVIGYDLSGWLYYLTSFNDGEFFDVNLIPCGHEEFPVDDLEYIGSILCEFELGEEIFMEVVDRVNIIMPSQLEFLGNKIEYLYDQILAERNA